MNAASLHLVIGHSVNTLPDSFRDRKALVAALLDITPARHPHRERLHQLLVELETHERHQLHLALDFKSAAATDGNGQAKSQS